MTSLYVDRGLLWNQSYLIINGPCISWYECYLHCFVSIFHPIQSPWPPPFQWQSTLSPSIGWTEALPILAPGHPSLVSTGMERGVLTHQLGTSRIAWWFQSRCAAPQGEKGPAVFTSPLSTAHGPAYKAGFCLVPLSSMPVSSLAEAPTLCLVPVSEFRG